MLNVRPKIPCYLALIGQIALTNQSDIFSFLSNSSFSLQLCKINGGGLSENVGGWFRDLALATGVVGESCVCVGQ